MTPPQGRAVRGDPLHVQVARNIRNQIEAGVLRHGDVLPSTRELAREWNVSVFTISEAMKILAAEGLVDSRSRSKRVITAPTQTHARTVLTTRPQLILIGGYAGSGKTELGRIIARQTGWPMLDKDTMTRPMLEGALELLGLSPNDRESEQYLTLLRPLEYQCLMAAVRENVDCGNSVVATAPFIAEFRDPSWLNRTLAAFDDAGASTTIVWVYCDADTMHTYLRHRGAARDATKLANWSGYLESIDLDFRPPVPHVVVDNSASASPLQLQASELLQAITANEASR